MFLNIEYFLRPVPSDYGLFSVFPTEYGFLFSFGMSRAEPHLPAQPINTIHRMRYTTHAANAPIAHHTDMFSQKCRMSKITDGINPTKLISILKAKQRKNPPFRFVPRICLLLSIYPAAKAAHASLKNHEICRSIRCLCILSLNVMLRLPCSFQETCFCLIIFG